MRLLSIITAILLSVSILFSQNETFMLGFTGTYPEVNTYSSSKNTDWSWYTNDLSMNFWQGQITINN